MITCIYGGAGKGKTRLASTWPKPIVHLDFDCGTASVSDPKDVYVVPMYKQEATMLDFQKPPAGKETDIIIKRWNDICNAINTGALKMESSPAGGWVPAGANAGTEVKPATLVVDSMSMFIEIIMESILRVNNIPVLRIQDYGSLRSASRQIFSMLRAISSKGIHVVLVCHEVSEKDEESGRIMGIYPKSVTAAASKELGREPDELYFMTTKNTPNGIVYQCNASPDRYREAKSRIGITGIIESPTFENVQGKILGKKT